jgi:hypothetical protein
LVWVCLNGWMTSEWADGCLCNSRPRVNLHLPFGWTLLLLLNQATSTSASAVLCHFCFYYCWTKLLLLLLLLYYVTSASPTAAIIILHLGGRLIVGTVAVAMELAPDCYFKRSNTSSKSISGTVVAVIPISK